VFSPWANSQLVSENIAAPGKFRKTKFTHEEDVQLTRLVETVGSANWREIAACMKTRNARQCRERYRNYLDPELRWEQWTPEEDALLIAKFRENGPKWNAISQFFTKRSDNALRNRWQQLNRRLSKHGRPSETPHPPIVVPVTETGRTAANPFDFEETADDPFDFWSPFAF
jgi:hypothetical protein